MKIYNSIETFLNSKIYVESFIPTMGNLHSGHLSLITEAKKISKNICVSIYVNDAQFTSKKDYDSYPVTLDEDIKKLEDLDIDYLLIPEKNDIYKFSEPFNTMLEPKCLTTDLCGEYRPGHFLAVIDIICRFFQIIKPKNIVLGEKDYQQIIVIKELIKIYKYKINVISSPTIRDSNGLALSSRNNLLSEQERHDACDIYRALLLSKKLLKNNVSIDKVTDEIHQLLVESPIKIEYFTIRDLKTLQHANDSDLIAFIAGYLGDVRLIDNIIIRSTS